MANNIIKRVWNQGSMTPIEDLQGSAFTNENGGHTFQISGVDSNGEALALSGTVAASFLRPDQTTVGISGSVSGGVASVTLSEECYGIPGRFGLVIFLTSDGNKTALYSCVGNVARSSTDAVAPGVVANVVDLINEIETAVGTIPASYSALMADIAPTYSSSALYAVGDYAWHEGDLKRCIVPITVGETYTPAHWTSAVVGDDVCALKSALMLKAANENISDSAIVGNKKILLGAKEVVIYDTGAISDSSTNRSSGYIPTNGFDKINISTSVGTSYAAVAYYDADFSYMKSVSHVGTGSTQNISESIPSGAAYVVFIHYGTGTYYAELISNGKSEIKNLKDEQTLLNEITEIDSKEVSGTDSTGFFINDQGVIYTGSSGLVITKYAVTAGKIYRIKGSGVKMQIKCTIVGFSTNGTLSANMQTEVIVLGNTVGTDYNLLYAPNEDGYLYASWTNSSGYGRIKVYDSTSIETIYDEISKVSYVSIAESGTKNAGYFIQSNGQLMAGGSQYCVTTYPVTQGEKYRIVGDDVKLYGAYGLVGFATTSTVESDKQTTLIQMGSSTATDYDFYYTPPEDGYLFCAWIDADGYTQLSVCSLETVASVIEESLNVNIPELGTKNTGCFILSSGKIITSSSESLCVSTYPVTQGKKYRIVGDDVKLLGSYGLVGFATTSTVVNDKQTVLIQMGSSTATDYDFYYTPSEDGYLFCSWIDASGYTQLSVCSLEPVANAFDDLMRHTQWSNVPIKMQVFGDSISDDTSRTTWASLIPTYLAQRTINLTNSAVGGSSYGHGHIDGKYGDHEGGNMVNDLLKDGTLQTDADIIVVFAGTNNWAGETPLGQWGDDTVSTFYGAVRDAFDYLSEHTNALVIVCTPCGRYNSTDASRSKNSDGLVLNPQGKTLRQFCDAIVETAHLYQYPVIDLYYDLGWNINNVSHYTEDGLHPNLIGANFLSQFIVGRMKTHLGI